jgi:low temperature requirement protein LtrA
MLSLVNYFALFLVAVFGIVVLDEDPTGVSVQEWIFFAIMIYSAVSMIRIFMRYFRDGEL